MTKNGIQNVKTLTCHTKLADGKNCALLEGIYTLYVSKIHYRICRIEKQNGKKFHISPPEAYIRAYVRALGRWITHYISRYYLFVVLSFGHLKSEIGVVKPNPIQPI